MIHADPAGSSLIDTIGIAGGVTFFIAVVAVLLALTLSRAADALDDALLRRREKKQAATRAVFTPNEQRELQSLPTYQQMINDDGIFNAAKEAKDDFPE